VVHELPCRFGAIRHNPPAPPHSGDPLQVKNLEEGDAGSNASRSGAKHGPRQVGEEALEVVDMAGEGHLITEVEDLPLPLLFFLRGVGAERGEESLEGDASGVAARWSEDLEAERLQASRYVASGAWSRNPHFVTPLNEFGAPGHAWPLPSQRSIKHVRHNQVIHEWGSNWGIKNRRIMGEAFYVDRGHTWHD